MIVYLHGFNSSPASGKAKLLGEHMASLGRTADYYCPTLPNSPGEAIARVEAHLAQRQTEPVTLVGSSLGGFYATHLAEKHGWKAVLVNPAVHAHVLMRGALGPQTNWHSGETVAVHRSASGRARRARRLRHHPPRALPAAGTDRRRGHRLSRRRRLLRGRRADRRERR